MLKKKGDHVGAERAAIESGWVYRHASSSVTCTASPLSARGRENTSRPGRAETQSQNNTIKNRL